MRDRVLIFAGLVVLVGSFTFPFWQPVGARSAASGPELELPADAEHCVAPLDYMRSSHMQLLHEWRDDVVRNQQRDYLAYDGQVFEMSLTKTCLGQCHTSREEFCDSCHAYAAVPTPNCWSCHLSVETTGSLE